MDPAGASSAAAAGPTLLGAGPCQAALQELDAIQQELNLSAAGRRKANSALPLADAVQSLQGPRDVRRPGSAGAPPAAPRASVGAGAAAAQAGAGEAEMAELRARLARAEQKVAAQQQS